MSHEFWQADGMAEAFASCHMGRVVRAYRTHPFHGHRPLSQELVAEWLGTSQPKLSRVENGAALDRLDLLAHWARVLGIPPEYLWFKLPRDGSGDESNVGGGLGAVSSERTAALVATLATSLSSPLGYQAPGDAYAQLSTFLSSQARVFVLAGNPGTGKTRLLHHAANELPAVADFQIHAAALAGVDLASEVLRYGSVAPGGDALLELERRSRELRRPCVVAIDGIADRHQLDGVGREVDRALRQVTTRDLKFILAIRTPPAVDISAFPVLAASTYASPSEPSGVSCTLVPWTPEQASQRWDGGRREGEQRFADLPARVRHLATLPLYMTLLKAAGLELAAPTRGAYQLVESCVHSMLRDKPDAEGLTLHLATLAAEELADVVPPELAGSRSQTPGRPPSADQFAGVPLVHMATAQGLTFGHDVIREYFLATQLAARLADMGPSVRAVRAINALAERAGSSATATGVFGFVVDAVDDQRPDLLEYVALSPTVNVHTTLPLLMSHADARFADDEVWTACARRCATASSVALVRAALASRRVADALQDEYPTWLLDVIKRFGPDMWPDAAGAIERHVDVANARRLVANTEIEDADQATFVARHVHLLWSEHDRATTEHLEGLLTHPDWRVRTALVHGLGDCATDSVVAQQMLDKLVADADYKVRAAASSLVTVAPGGLGMRYLSTLLNDESWHVRASTLRQLGDSDRPDPVLLDAAVDVMAGDRRWDTAPAHVAELAERLRLLCALPPASPARQARARALQMLLREVLTGWRALPPSVHDALIGEAKTSDSWLVRHEADLLANATHNGVGRTPLLASQEPREGYRRLRDRRAVQVALDVADLDYAVEVAQAAAEGGVELIEVGDPLIKEHGLRAVERVKQAVPEVTIVAEMMSADWGRDQVVLAAQAGADIAFLIGPASIANVATAVRAAHRLGLPLVLDVPAHRFNEQWVRDMEQVGVDGFAVTTNIDLGLRGRNPFSVSQRLRTWTSLPVSVSGGFTPLDRDLLGSPDWDIVVVGRGVTEARNPTAAARQIVAAVRRSSENLP